MTVKNKQTESNSIQPKPDYVSSRKANGKRWDTKTLP